MRCSSNGTLRRIEPTNVSTGTPSKRPRVLFTSGRDFLEIYDAEHSQTEDRYIGIGSISRGTIVVIYTERGENKIRFVSARMATKHEAEQAAEYWRRTNE